MIVKIIYPRTPLNRILMLVSDIVDEVWGFEKVEQDGMKRERRKASILNAGGVEGKPGFNFLEWEVPADWQMETIRDKPELIQCMKEMIKTKTGMREVEVEIRNE